MTYLRVFSSCFPPLCLISPSGGMEKVPFMSHTCAVAFIRMHLFAPFPSTT